jgi:hypothetical protein
LTKRLSVLILAVGLLAGACSSGGGGKTPEKAAYIKQANAICKKGNTASDAIGKSINTNDEKAVLNAVHTRLVPLIRQQLKDIRALGYPKGDKDKLEALFTKEDKILDKYAKETTLSAPTAAEDPSKALTAYGLTECGNT